VLPADVAVTFRSKSTGGRLVTVPAQATVVTAQDSRWEDVTTALKGSRLNAPAGDSIARWATDATIYALAPTGTPCRARQLLPAVRAAQPAATPATTLTWHPWHLNGRPKWRRGTRH